MTHTEEIAMPHKEEIVMLYTKASRWLASGLLWGSISLGQVAPPGEYQPDDRPEDNTRPTRLEMVVAETASSGVDLLESNFQDVSSGGYVRTASGRLVIVLSDGKVPIPSGEDVSAWWRSANKLEELFSWESSDQRGERFFGAGSSLGMSST